MIIANESTLANDPRIQRLLNNPNWKPAAEAAMKFLLEGKVCPIASWKKSSTWAQVKMVWEEQSPDVEALRQAARAALELERRQ
jgi:hypothetical protein